MLKSTLRLYAVCLTALMLSVTGCEGANIVDSGALESLPDLAFGGPKADQPSSNTTLGQRLDSGDAISGRHAGYMAFPLSAQAGESIPVQAWTSEASVVFVYGPQQGGQWDMEQVRAWSERVQPGVETRRLNFEAPETGEYLVVVGSVDNKSSDWIIARGATPSN